MSAWSPHDGFIKFLQDICRLEMKTPGERAMRRTATLFVVDRYTGNQIIAESKTRYYEVAPGDELEEIFDKHHNDELLISAR